MQIKSIKRIKKVSDYNIKRFLLDVVYPNKCPFCGEFIAYNRYFCSDCSANFKAASEIEPIANLADTFAIFDYNEEISPFVYSIKDGEDGFAISAAAELLRQKIADIESSIDLITCIPTDSHSFRIRGYNPPGLIAAEISAMTGIKCDVKLLKKTRRTRLQKSLSKPERQENVKGAFAVNKKRVFSETPKTILLIDDVRTTGATLSEAASVLLNSVNLGVEKVYAGVVACVTIT